MQSPEEAAANSSSVTSLLRQFSSLHQSNPGSPATGTGVAGLDLSYKRDMLDMADDMDKDSIAESNRSGECNMDMDDPHGQQAVVAPAQPSNSSSSSSRSRRKPAAPQWVRPEWNKVPEDGSNVVPNDTSSKSETINGVCVMNSNSAAYSLGNSEGKEEASNHSDQEDKE